MKIRKIILSAILMAPVVIAAANGFAPMEGTITYSWGNSIITSEVKSLIVNPPLVLFIGALVYGLYRSNLAFRMAPAISFLYSFLTLWLVWSGVSWDLFGVFYYAVIFAFVGLIGAIIAYLIHILFIKLFSVKKQTK